MKAALFGTACASILLFEVWANLNPIRSRLGLPELPLAAVYREPSGIAKDQHPTNNQSNAELGSSPAPANPSPDVAGYHPDDGKGLDLPAWIQAMSAVATGIATVFLVKITSRQAGFAEKQIEISGLQTTIYDLQATLMGRQTDIYERQANIAEGQREISDRQAGIAQRQTEIMASQRDISLATERAWVRADIRITGPVQVAQSAVTLSFEVDLINSGALPAYATRPDINVYPWGARTGVSDDHITYRWMRFKPDRVVRQSVIFPQQTVVLDYQGSIRVSEIEQASNTRGQGKDGFVAAIRGVVWYDYPGTDEVHSTIFHAHIVRKGEPGTPASWGTLPAEDGAFVPTVDLTVTHQIGETDAT